MMTAKEFLRQYEEAERKARQHKAEYERELELIGSWKMAELDAIRVRQIVYDTIHDIPGIEGQVLYERYINLHKWEEICVLVHYSWQGVHKVHKRALLIVESRLK